MFVSFLSQFGVRFMQGCPDGGNPGPVLSGRSQSFRVDSIRRVQHLLTGGTDHRTLN